jgi:hypothetical protein
LSLASKSFTIHGLWPSSATQETYQDFSLDYVKDNKKLHDDLTDIWPPQTNYPITDKATADTFDRHWLWEHEWNKHGKDFANILQVLRPDGWKQANSEKLQTAYFRTALNLLSKNYKGLLKIR